MKKSGLYTGKTDAESHYRWHNWPHKLVSSLPILSGSRMPGEDYIKFDS